MPSKDLFNLDQPVLKEHLTINRHTAAMQKYAFTKIWFGSQQGPDQLKCSRLRKFSVALEAYFDKDSPKHMDDSNLKSEQKEPEKTTEASLKDNNSVKEYVSPFPNKPVQPAPKVSPLLKGVKGPTIVPAGFDLSQLVEFKNPNHWHRRPHMCTGDSIY
ncbi:uncharacterized protein LOC108045022 [Drosophila rhopaloa]|uniref:Uncharacterized protein LOC108045022 n=1 Tax=Drosophila rhopaloa TaxID=1041015 RepID=A0A6P4EX71_DRORH|nr:uncharacterized protein LOC108045022 [Drosophila rhopaloa]